MDSISKKASKEKNNYSNNNKIVRLPTNKVLLIKQQFFPIHIYTYISPVKREYTIQNI